MQQREHNHTMIPGDLVDPMVRKGIGYDDQGREAALYRKAFALSDQALQQPISNVPPPNVKRADQNQSTKQAAQDVPAQKTVTQKMPSQRTEAQFAKAPQPPQKPTLSLHPEPQQTIRQKQKIAIKQQTLAQELAAQIDQWNGPAPKRRVA